MDTKAKLYSRIQATQELHSLSKTYTLLIKDLPFVTNLSKYYDQDILNSSYNDSLCSKGTYSNNNDRDTDKIPIGRKAFDKPENSDNPFEFNVIKDDTKEDNAMEDNNCESPQHKKVDDEITATMQAQLNYRYDNGESISKDHLECIQRLKEIFDD